jgi:hypothetical protein
MAGRSNCKFAAIAEFDTPMPGEDAAWLPRPEAPRHASRAIQQMGGEPARGGVSHLKPVGDGHAPRASTGDGPRYICIGLAVIRI